MTDIETFQNCSYNVSKLVQDCSAKYCAISATTTCQSSSRCSKMTSHELALPFTKDIVKKLLAVKQFGGNSNDLILNKWAIFRSANGQETVLAVYPTFDKRRMPVVSLTCV